MDEAIGRTLYPVNTGTSVLALSYDQGVMIAADTLVSFGSMARYHNVSRLFKANEHTLIGVGGDMGDFQYVRNMIECKIIDMKAIDRSYEFSPSDLHAWLSVVMYNRRSKFNPLCNNYIVGGVVKKLDKYEPYLGTVNRLGVSYKNPFITTGVGSYMIQQTLENEFIKATEDTGGKALTQESAEKLLHDCIEILYHRDARAHNKYEIGIITQKGVEIVENKEIIGKWDIASCDNNYT